MKTDYPMVYRHLDRPTLKGRLCRIVGFSEQRRWKDGSLMMGTLSEAVALEFEDGARVMAPRNAVVRVRSRVGRRYLGRRPQETT